MDKQLSQAMMVRSKLRNKFLKLKTEENRLTYVKQRNYGNYGIVKKATVL